MENENEPEKIEREQFATVEAQNVEMTQACAINVLSDEVKMHQSSAGIVKAENVNMKESFALVIQADNIEGDAKALLSPTSAVIAGGIILLGIYLWRRR